MHDMQASSLPDLLVPARNPEGGVAEPLAKAVENAQTEVRSAAPPRLRVAMVLYRDDLNVGGSLRVVEILAHALDPRRVEAHIVFAYGGPDRSQAAPRFLVIFSILMAPWISVAG